jgi:putative ABC transport system permease protein
VSSKITEMVDGVAVPVRHYPTFTAEDEAAAAAEIAGARWTALQAQGRSIVAAARGQHRRAVPITVTTADFAELAPLSFAAGRYFTVGEARHNAPVLVLNYQLAAELADPADPLSLIGRTVQVFGTPRTVIGILAREPGSREKTAFAPLRAARDVLAPEGHPRTPTLLVKAATVEEVTALRSNVEDWLARRYGRWEDRIEVVTQQQRLAQTAQGMLIFKLLMGAITGISLVVGGIGIMNVMLASVAERTREVGIRKAIGARSRDVLMQFLAEAVAISGLGSVAGMALGVTVASAITWFMRRSTNAGIHAVMTADTFAVAVLASVLVGLLFGTYPARRAAALAPIDAIGYE